MAPPELQLPYTSPAMVRSTRHMPFAARHAPRTSEGPVVTDQNYCQRHRRYLPDRFPVQPRAELATRRPPVVATRAGEVLLCDGQHEGPHIWPDGDEAVPEESCPPESGSG
jgi:hypothetical protein